MNRGGLVVINSSPSWGGNEEWALLTAAGMAARGRPVHFAWRHEAVGERVRDAGLENSRLGLHSDFDPATVASLANLARRTAAAALLPTRWREYLLGGLASRLARRPRVVLRLGLRMVPRPDAKRRLVFRLADRILVNAPEIRDDLATTGWIDSDKISVVINGLDINAWHPAWTAAGADLRRSARAELGLAEDVPLAVNVGALNAQKDQATLIEACARLRDRMPDLRTLIVGEGDLCAELRARIDACGLANRVLLTGFRPDVAALLAAADLFVLSSRNEGMARVLIEAAAAGLPTVATDVSGVHFCVEDGSSGLIVPPGDAGALAASMADLLADPELRLVMGRRARVLAGERFSLQRMLEETEAVLFG